MFRFTIRELALVSVIVAMAIAWWIDRSRVAQERQVWRTVAEQTTTAYAMRIGSDPFHLQWKIYSKPWPSWKNVIGGPPQLSDDRELP